MVTHNVDMENISEEDLGKHLDKALRQALDVNYEALKNLKHGAMYVPMEKNPANSKGASRENTDYDTFGSIDSLIFEPKIPSEEDIEEVQEEITQSFEYLEMEDDGQSQEQSKDAIQHFQSHPHGNRQSKRLRNNAIAVGKTSFAERVRLFQSLGHKKPEGEVEKKDPINIRGSPTNDSFLHGQGKTTWAEQAQHKGERSGRESAASDLSHSTNSSGSTVIYNVTIAESLEEETAKEKTAAGSFLDESPPVDKSAEGRTDPGECSTCTSLSCDCWEEEEEEGDSCTCDDCPGCSQPTLRRYRGSQASPEFPGRRGSPDEQVPSRPESGAREMIPSSSRPESGARGMPPSSSRPDSAARERPPSSSKPASGASERPPSSSRRRTQTSASKQRNTTSSPVDGHDKLDSRNRSSKSSPTPQNPLLSSPISSSPSPRSKKATTKSSPKPPAVIQDVEHLIPVVGNLRRQLRENFNRTSLNIEKNKPKKGFIIEDVEEETPRAPSVENMNRMSNSVQERIQREERFQKLQTREQFRSITPEVPPPRPPKSPPRKDGRDGGGLLVEVQDGKPLIYNQEVPQQSIESEGGECKRFDLESPKGKGSEMGDSGISSNPASMSPHSSASGSSSTYLKTVEDKEPAIMKKLALPGGKKRDTMIRELKFKLKERFPEDKPDPRSLTRGERRVEAGNSETYQSQRAEVGPKLTKIFGSLMSEAGPGPGQATLLRHQKRREEPLSRNLGVPQDDISTMRSSRLPTVKEFEYHDSLCPSIYDPSLPPGLEHHVDLAPPPPPPTQTSSKRGSVCHSCDEASVPSRPSSDLAAPLDRRELLYGPGGIFGAKGPFSTPGLSRYPEVINKTDGPGVGQPKSSTTSSTEESGLFDGDRSDKSQYICNHVITLPEVDPFMSSRLENYRSRVSPETPVELSAEQVTALSNPDQEAVERWVEEKQRRMMSWVARGGQVRSQAS